MKESEIKLEEFNDCPGTQGILDAMQEHDIHFDPVDTERQYWQNDSATMVLTLDKKTKTENWGAFISQIRADEYHITKVDGKKVIRLWWD